MKHYSLLRLIVGLLMATCAAGFAAERVEAPFSPEQAEKTMRVPPGFVVTLVASEPTLVQPISFCQDDQGRLFVAEALNYGEWQPAGQDRIVILTDTDGDSRVDSRTVFYEGFNYITGIEVGFGGVWVMSPPNLFFVPDRDQNDQPDGEPQILFDGFGHKESRHNLANGFTWGPDGWLYAGHGRTSPSLVGRPGTPEDQRILCDGGVYRIHPTRHVFENFADGTTNPWGVSFDDFGQCFVSNCVNPHLFHVVQGAHYEPWRNRPSSLYAYDRIATCADHLHYPTGQPKAMRGETQETLDMGGGHAHCGTLIYLGDRYPRDYRNSVFMCNVHGHRINNDILRRKGSSYVATHSPDLMIATDPWFMGVTLQTSADGNVLVSDWSDTGECHTYKPERGTGRIYKISFGPPPPTLVNLDEKSDSELAQLQLHENDWHVQHARRLLQERAASSDWDAKSVHDALQAILADNSEATRRLRALWALHVTGGLSPAQLHALLEDSDEHVRGWTIQLLCESGDPARNVIDEFAVLAEKDPSPVVRLYLAAALQRLRPENRWAIANALSRHAEDASDLNLPLMYWYGIEPLISLDPSEALQLGTSAQIPRLREFVGRRVVDHFLTQEDPKLDALVAALAPASEAAQRDLLAGAREALRGRRTMAMPDGWPELRQRLHESPDPRVRESVTALSVLFGDAEILADLRRIAMEPSLPESQRRTALETLLEKGLVDIAPNLHDLLEDPRLRLTAIRGLAVVTHPDTPGQILKHYATFNSTERTEAVTTLASRKEFAKALLDAVEEQRIPRNEISAYVARQIYSLRDAELNSRLVALWGEVRDTQPQKQEQIARFKKMLSPSALEDADLKNGRLLYKKTCQQCHTLFGEGNKIGPDLSGSNRANLDYWLINILDPSAEIGRDYRMHVATTIDGRVLTGMLVERTPARLTIQTATERIFLSSDELDELSESSASMMPEGQFERLTRDQVRDLIAYLSAPSQVALPEQSSDETPNR